MKLFKYSVDETITLEDASQETVTKSGYSFDLEKVTMTYPESNHLNVVLNQNADKINPVEYEYKVDRETKQRVPVRVKKFEITSEPIVVTLTREEDITAFWAEMGSLM